MKKLIAILLCLTMVLSLASGVFANEEEKKTINYVSFGASQTWGLGSCYAYPEQYTKWTGTKEEQDEWTEKRLGAKAWNPRDIKSSDCLEEKFNTFGIDYISKTSFPYLVKEQIEKQGYEVIFKQLAISGSTAGELLAFLSGGDLCEASGNYFKDYIFPEITDSSYEEAFVSFSKKYQDAVETANFITIDYGENDISEGVWKMVGNISDDPQYNTSPEYERILSPEDYEIFMHIRETLIEEFNKVFEKCGIDEENVQPIRDFIDNEAYGILAYCSNMDKIIQTIHDINPKAVVCVLQVQNFYSGLTLSYNGYEIPAGDLLQIVADIVNTYISSFSQYSSTYYYAVTTENQRVEFNLDVLKKYSGPEDLTDYFKTMLDVEDTSFDIHIKSMLTPEYEKVKGKVYDLNYDKALNASYDGTLQLLSYIINNYTATFSGLMSGDVSKIIPIINTMLGEISDSFVNGDGNYSKAIANAKANFDKLPEDEKGAIGMLLLTQMSSYSWLHPTAKGQKEMAQGVINAMKNHNIGLKSQLRGIVVSAKSVSKSMKTIGDCIDDIVASFVEESVDYVYSKIPTKDQVATYIKQKVKNNVNAVVSKVISKLKLITK